MSRKQGRGIPGSLNRAEIMITNASNDAIIADAIAKVGYGPDRMAEGKAILALATSKKAIRVSLSGAKKEATAAATAARHVAAQAFQAYSTLAKGAFAKKKETLSVLGLVGPAPRTEAMLIEGGKTLFENATNDPAIKTVMLKYGYDDEKLATESAKVLAFEKANTIQKAAEGAAQDATDDQAKVMLQLKEWVAQFRKAAKIALSNNKQLLEKLGIRVRSTRTRAQRGAAKKAAATRAAKKNKTP